MSECLTGEAKVIDLEGVMNSENLTFKIPKKHKGVVLMACFCSSDAEVSNIFRMDSNRVFNNFGVFFIQR